jgi:hypothetical protein
MAACSIDVTRSATAKVFALISRTHRLAATSAQSTAASAP